MGTDDQFYYGIISDKEKWWEVNRMDAYVCRSQTNLADFQSGKQSLHLSTEVSEYVG